MVLKSALINAPQLLAKDYAIFKQLALHVSGEVGFADFRGNGRNYCSWRVSVADLVLNDKHWAQTALLATYNG